MYDIGKMFDLGGKVAVVTGGGDGIGRASCEILASAGASVVVSDLSPDKAKVVADSIAAAGGKSAAVGCNVLEDADLEHMIDFAASTFGTVNILVNNAGMGGGGRENPFKIDRAYVERIYAMNVFAPWQLCKLAAPHMQSSGYGSIINITSMSSVNNDPDMAIYGSSKAALNHLASNLAYDYGPMGIRINCVAPGATRTHALASVLTPEMEARMLSHTPIKRLGEASDIARVVLFFASPASTWISGQVLMVNGGGVQTLE
ncbi:glucose 1-dehydrogenase [uncultured Duncaniella sp.]|uniref:glucose 1-dehydrogenase n=3 Tax=uncultured Duncaniella sp. TaxID=2768039 RepID=UPI0026586617|nr:glucose 1-dehydrogenase [uncultured Duncaniella sp.]